MSELKLFENSKFGSVRVIMRDGVPWFVATDVCKCLGLGQVSRALVSLDEDERSLLPGEHSSKRQSLCTRTNSTPHGNGCSPTAAICSPSGFNIVSESGLYSLVLRSRKPEAKAFKRWVTHEVLPSIRETGSYSQTPTSYLDALKQCVALEEARIAAEAEKQKVQLALEQEQTAHEVTVQELQQALEQLGIAGEYSGVRTQTWLYDYFKSSAISFKMIGRFLSAGVRKYVPSGAILIKKISVNRWNGKVIKVNVYRNDLWGAFKLFVESGVFNKDTKFIGPYFK